MVFINRVFIRNFKSFGGEPIKLNFQPGFNIITGPNGSGKSNILDAMQFALGELGSKRMRAPDLSGLIYDGAGESLIGRAQIAEVRLNFDNTDKILPYDRNTVSIGRKMDRDGKSDYYINGKKTSRRNVIDMLEIAGITPGGYNIVLQGTATRLSDLTPSERMNSLEDLVGISEYDEKKSAARERLSEAERKLEVAQARILEIKKQVNELEEQRNNALLFDLLNQEENRLTALRLSNKLINLEEKLGEISSKIKEKEEEIKSIEEEQVKLIKERDSAQQRLDEFNREASEKGNTQLPLLRSELVGKNTLQDSLEKRIQEIKQRKIVLNKTILEKEAEIESSRDEIINRNAQLQELKNRKEKIQYELDEKRSELADLNQKIQSARETAEQNQKRIEELTELLIPMQESLSGINTEINKHDLAVESLTEKISDYSERKEAYLERRQHLEDSIKEYERLKQEEANKLEDMIKTVEDQVRRQRNIRSTIENANQLAKDAETTITEFTAKKELWDRLGTDEKALDRIREIGEAGAMDGYHGPLRSLIKVDLPYQRAVRSSADGWINAVIIDDLETAKECIRRLKKTKLGMTRFIPLENLRDPISLPELDSDGIIGAIPHIIRYDEYYAPAVYLLWGDTYLVENETAAEIVTASGYRAVTKTGDVFETSGGVIGGYYRRPPNYKKIIPSEQSIENLSTTIKSLRSRLSNRMKELRSSGFDLRKFTQYMEDSQERVKRIEEEMQSTRESIERLDRNLNTLIETTEKTRKDLGNQKQLKVTLEERRKNTLKQIEETKEEITQLREIKLSDVASLELERNTINHEISLLEKTLNDVENDRTIQSSLVDRILNLKITEAEEDIAQSQQELVELESEKKTIEGQLKEIGEDVQELASILNQVTKEVEATTSIFEQHQKTLRQINTQIDQLGQRRNETERKKGQLELDKERLRLQAEQILDELSRLGFSDRIEVDDLEFEQVERKLNQIRREKRSLGAINQLAMEQYDITMREYKHRSTRINGMEEEKQSILNFIDEIEQEKQEHFMKAYNEICENFSSIFSKLTGGGDGQLELQNPEDPFSDGVDLYVQFPGKPMRLVGGASGGERSVAAIAYLLAIQRFLKAPFYLFDEIDAHLDDINTSRLAEVLKENALDSQFLMISLKDVMVHNADRIYGVFAQSGRSRVLSLPMKEAKVAA